MKVALCISGRWNEYCHSKWVDRSKQLLPFDEIFTGTWEGQDVVVDYYFPEPKNEYHPVFDTEPYPDDASTLRREVFPRLIEKDIHQRENDLWIDPASSQLKHAYASANWHKQILIHLSLIHI